MQKNSSVNDELEEEIAKRIDMMESETYEHVPSINRNDVIGMFIVSIVCIIGLIWGVM